MKNFSIPQPCHENFAAMTPTEQGAFCNKCATNTFDFRNKTTDEIKQVLRANIGKQVCGQFSREQEEKLNAEFEVWSFRSTRSFQSAFLFTLIATFGLTLFSCTEKQHEAEIVQFQETAKNILANGAAFEKKLPMVDEQEIAPVEVVPPAIEELVYEIPVVETREYLLDDVVIQDVTERYYVTSGISFQTMEYTNYLIQTVPLVEEFDAQGRLIPTEYSALAFPNPTADNSTIEIKIPATGQFQVDLYDMNGKHYSEIYSGIIERGMFQQSIEMTDLPPGMYLVTILSKDYKETVRISKL